MLLLLGGISAKADELVGQLALNYQDSDKEETIPYVLITHEKVIPLKFANTDGIRRTLSRLSGDIIHVNGDALMKTIPGYETPMGGSPPTQELEAIQVIQFAVPIYEMTFAGQIELKYRPETQTTVFLIKDSMGPTRTVYVPKYIHDQFVEEYFEQTVQVTVRVIRIKGEDRLFVKEIQTL